MSKKKNINRINTEKDLAKLMNEIGKQDFKSKDELHSFLNNMMGKSLDDLPDRKDKKGRSQDLVYEAYELPVSQGKKLIKQALELDPNNADAFNYLAGIEDDTEKASKIFEKAVKAGEKSLGKKFIAEEKGHFWGILETRPYMRAKAGLADCLYALKETDKAIGIYEEMLELNPNDNQGIRYLLSALLLSKKDFNKYELLNKEYEGEDNAVWNYNYALYGFMTTGKTVNTEKILLKAFKSNKFVIDYMLGRKEMPDEQPQYVGLGDENEAVVYVSSSWTLWNKTEGALDWLYEFMQKRLKMN